MSTIWMSMGLIFVDGYDLLAQDLRYIHSHNKGQDVKALPIRFKKATWMLCHPTPEP